MNDEEHLCLVAAPTFATVDEYAVDLEYRFRGLGLSMGVPKDEDPYYFFTLSIFDETTSVVTMALTSREFYRYLRLATREGEEAAYNAALDQFRAYKGDPHERL